jgi:hypothetical protein
MRKLPRFSLCMVCAGLSVVLALALAAARSGALSG